VPINVARSDAKYFLQHICQTPTFPSYLAFEVDDAHPIVEQSDRLSSRSERSCSARPVLVPESWGPKWTNAFGTLECSISKARILPLWDRAS
jgi:hypothetical protein